MYHDISKEESQGTTNVFPPRHIGCYLIYNTGYDYWSGIIEVLDEVRAGSCIDDDNL